MRYKVPQDVQREDTILFFITMRQLVLLMIGGGISYFLWVNLSKRFELSTLETILIWMPAIICAAFAFVKIKHIPLFQFILLLVEQLFFRAPRRFWQNNTGVFVSMTTGFHTTVKKKIETVNNKQVSRDKIKNLAKFMDGK